MFKEILLDNPYLYFTNFIVKNKLKTVESTKKSIVVVDFNLISNDLNSLKELLDNKNIHLIILHSDYLSSVTDIYKMMSDNVLLINKKDRLKLMQKQLHSKVISCLINIKQSDYLKLINHENIKHIIIKNKELRYTF